ncbi:MAG: hypothetical protein JWM05_1413 [Acidimicrobiales bacterium]|nr:hypothetical protein [Acidimicrobiales bacterium]
MRIKVAAFALALASLVAAEAGAQATEAVTSAVPPASPPVRVDIGSTYRVERVIGAHSPNRTDLTGDVAGGDQGNMFGYKGKTYMAFGDSYGGAAVPVDTSFWTTARPDWRSNTVAVSSDTNPADGLTFSGMITDQPQHAEEPLSSLKNNTELTVIPTYGTSVGNRMFLHYMSIKTFGDGNVNWICNGAGLAYSDDGGHVWTKRPLTWSATSNFEQVSFVQAGTYTYMFGVPCYQGGVQIARVPSASLLDPSAYRYWTGAAWSPTVSAAKTIVPASPATGQFSVRYNTFFKKWIMLATSNIGILLRTADSPVGPWSAHQQVIALSNPLVKCLCVYSPMITPYWNDGPDIWFTLSDGLNYDVSLVHTSLTRVGAPSAPRSPVAVSGNGAVTLSWTKPASTGSAAAPITGYIVTAYYSGSAQYAEQFARPPMTFDSTATTETITGLNPGTSYTFKVAAKNSIGVGAQSALSRPATAR